MIQFSTSLRRADKSTRLAIYGAGQCGRLVAEDILKHEELNYTLKIFIDDDLCIQRKNILGYRVYSRYQAEQYLEDIDEILIAIPSILPESLRSITEWCKSTGTPFHLIPGYYRLLEKKAYPGTMRNVTLEDLLHRQTRVIDTELLKGMYTGKTILVTGAGGSIGSDLCKQIVQLRPKQLILSDASESNLFYISDNLNSSGYTHSIPVLGNLSCQPFVEKTISKYRPQIVFHAAAFKHVPMLESNVSLAVLNNVLSTKNLLSIATEFNAERFVQISTDKAVKPSSIMGATKRICELLVKTYSSSIDGISVRFGNVLESSGSLVPIVRSRLANNLPVSITDRRMRRYFMSIAEAVSLVLHVGANGRSGSIYVLDMGEDYLVLDIIKQTIRLEGYIPDKEVKIIETGLRPGEKLEETLSISPESLVPTSHPSINEDVNDPPAWVGFPQWVDNLITSAKTYDDSSVKSIINRLVYKSKESCNE